MIAAILTTFNDEVAYTKGLYTVKIHWDMEKFYDNVDTNKLVTKIVELDYPLVVGALGMMMHMAPRVVKANSS